MHSEQPKKYEINYLYFISLLAFLIVLTLFHFLKIDPPLFGVPLFFLLQAIGQIFLEVGLFLFIAYLLKKWAPKWLHLLFISLCFILLLVQFTDFILGRLMDTSIAYPLKFFLGKGADGFLVSFKALNLNTTMLLIILSAILLIPACGLLFYWITYRIAHLRPLRLSLTQIAVGLGSIGASLFLLDLLVHPFVDKPIYAKYQKALPFKTTFLSPSSHFIQLPHLFARPRDEETTLQKIPSLSLQKKPNLYLFVIETLRRDYLTSQTAPNLTSFAQENLQFDASFSNANSTHLSWFAIFHANLPHHWTSFRDTGTKGSLPLQLLKKLGYRIRVYSSADLRYFNMDKILFGQNRDLIDSIEDFSRTTMEPWERDAKAVSAFARDLQQDDAKEANVFLFFFDSTHSEYSFPLSSPLPFEPIPKEIDYLTLGPKSQELEGIKNRYRNAIHYVDSLFGACLSHLKDRHLYEEAILSVTGDHGEEFFEEGALFHGTHLNRYQTSVPIYFKIPNHPPHLLQPAREATHIDLFPTLLHALTRESQFEGLFDGRSVFLPARHPYRIAVLHNGPDTPCEFSIENGKARLHVRFPSGQNIYTHPTLEIVDIQTSSEPQTLDAYIQTHFPNAFDPLISDF